MSVQDGSKEFNHNQLPNQKLDEFDELDEGGPYKDENEIYDDDNRINMGAHNFYENRRLLLHLTWTCCI